MAVHSTAMHSDATPAQLKSEGPRMPTDTTLTPFLETVGTWMSLATDREVDALATLVGLELLRRGLAGGDRAVSEGEALTDTPAA